MTQMHLSPGWGGHGPALLSEELLGEDDHRATCKHCGDQVLRPWENGPASAIRPGLLMPEMMVYRNRRFQYDRYSMMTKG